MKFAKKTNIFNKPLQIKIFLRISHLVSFHFIKLVDVFNPFRGQHFLIIFLHIMLIQIYEYYADSTVLLAIMEALSCAMVTKISTLKLQITKPQY